MDSVLFFRAGRLLGSVAAAAMLCAPAMAQQGSSDLSGYIDFRAAAADGQSSWLNGDYGKARYGGDRDFKLRGRFEVAEAAVIWHPRFSETMGATVHLQYEPGQDHAVDIIESYVSFKTPPGA